MIRITIFHTSEDRYVTISRLDRLEVLIFRNTSSSFLSEEPDRLLALHFSNNVRKSSKTTDINLLLSSHLMPLGLLLVCKVPHFGLFSIFHVTEAHFRDGSAHSTGSTPKCSCPHDSNDQLGASYYRRGSPQPASRHPTPTPAMPLLTARSFPPVAIMCPSFRTHQSQVPLNLGTNR